MCLDCFVQFLIYWFFFDNLFRFFIYLYIYLSFYLFFYWDLYSVVCYLFIYLFIYFFIYSCIYLFYLFIDLFCFILFYSILFLHNVHLGRENRWHSLVVQHALACGRAYRGLHQRTQHLFFSKKITIGLFIHVISEIFRCPRNSVSIRISSWRRPMLALASCLILPYVFCLLASRRV